MKIIFVFLCVVVAVLAKGLPNLPEGERTKLSKVHESCQSNPRTYCDEDKLRNLVNNVDDRTVGTHMLCMAVKAGLMSDNGEFNINTMKDKISLVTQDKSKVDGFVKQCSHKYENPGKTANKMWICFVQNGIQYYYPL